MVLREQQNQRSGGYVPRSGDSCPPGVRSEHGFEPSTANDTTVISALRLSAVSISREPQHAYRETGCQSLLARECREIKAPPLTTSYGWTGTAFDYAMRFYLQKLNPSANARRWLAEESATLVVASRHETARTKKRMLGILVTAKDCVRSYLKSKSEANLAAS
jgi:hypothetical protein